MNVDSVGTSLSASINLLAFSFGGHVNKLMDALKLVPTLEKSHDTRITQQYFLIFALEYAFMYVYLIEEAGCVAGMSFLLLVR